MNKLSLVGLIVLFVWGCSGNNSELVAAKNQWNDQPEMDRFLDSLMTEMTLEEKIGQTVLFASWWDVTGPVSDNNIVEDAKQGKWVLCLMH